MAAQDAQPWHFRYPDLDHKNFELHGRSLLLPLIVLAALVFFTLLLIYVRWGIVCGPSGPRARPPWPSGLDPKVIGGLPVLLYRRADEDAEEDAMCSICLSVFVEGEKVKQLPKCGHMFHPECVDEWLRTRSTCPLCRACVGELQRAEVVDAAV